MTVAFADLPAPRPLTPAERAVLATLVAHAGRAELTAQLATARVTAVCDCGCASVRLATTGPALPRAAVKAMSEHGRDDHVAVGAAAGRVDAVLHVVGGRLHELELFAGEGVKVVPPPPAKLAGFHTG
ncbi:hypothetical protein KZZ52_19815 [Dactylosporangium sp. AC04546]|uniref:hypothetical protein n=1 Tax=Dactylosporangium sp. AC04546 TaxID=2862460 RepID=UPI001EDE5A46|nr:hypothetical protein [Dactylosporangium sp. AC04546]WVK87545.1 hypothetical protein KZZ52_19815 [Dactylosporangium sp. AC04546]